MARAINDTRGVEERQKGQSEGAQPYPECECVYKREQIAEFVSQASSDTREVPDKNYRALARDTLCDAMVH